MSKVGLPLVEAVGATGLAADYIRQVEEEAARYNIKIVAESDRYKLMILYRSLPSFPGWYPVSEGGAPEAFWLNYVSPSGKSRAVSGGIAYYLRENEGLNDFAMAGGFNTINFKVILEDEALEEAQNIRDCFGISGNLIVWDTDDRASDFSYWITETAPALNKAIMSCLYPRAVNFIAFPRESQLNHLGSRYGYPRTLKQVLIKRRFLRDEIYRLGIQTQEEALGTIRSRLHC